MKTVGINARHLEVFLKLMTSRNLGEAADKLSISQPAVSKTIHYLEDELGVALFTRVKGRLQPTHNAHELMPYVQRAVGQLDVAKDIAYGLKSGSTGQVTLASGAPALTSIVPLAVRRFQEAHPGVKIAIRTEPTSTVINLVSNHEVDLGISVSPLQSTDARLLQKCRTQILAEEEMVVVMPKSHRLAKQTVVRPVDLRDETIVSLPDDSPNMLHVKASFQQARMTLNIGASVTNSIGVCALVRENIGLGFINPLQLSSGLFPDLVARPFRPHVVLRTLMYFSAFQPLTPPAQALADCLTEAARAAKAATKAHH